jgi:benzoate/toluate 1,2-dioxygenase reductase subunit
MFLAGGTGLAPFLAMLDHLRDKGGPTPPIRLLYGVTRDVDMVEVGKLQQFTTDLPDFTFEVCVADAASGASRKGFVTDHFGPEDLHGGDSDVYLCGPPPMVEAVRKHLDAIGITPASFRYEKFNASEAA